MVSTLLLHRRIRNLTVNKVVIAFVLIVIFVNEFLVYSLQTFRWNDVPVHRNKEEEIVALLVSDPQLIGIQDEMSFPVGPLARWDSDRYLRKTFSRAYRHAQPDIVIFLGDIMDEGSKATTEEYLSYADRFNNIFYEAVTNKVIVVPGDNDIGGEGGDFRTPLKVNRFEKKFENLTGVVNYGFVDFIKLDIRFHREMVTEKRQQISRLASKLSAPVRIIVNHESMMPQMKYNIYPILKMAQPNMLFSGHWHVSQMFTCDSCLSDNEDAAHWPVHKRQIASERDYIAVDFTDLIAVNEIMVPTCSYRMGVPDMGYGVAVIRKSGHMVYTVLWQPSRYILLYIYLVSLAIVALILLLDFILSPILTKKVPYTSR